MQDSLRQAESNATAPLPDQPTEGLNAVAATEESGGLFTGTGRTEQPVKKKFRKGPSIVIGGGGLISLILMFFVATPFTSPLLNFKEVMLGQRGTSSALINRRSNVFVGKLFNTNRNITSTTIFGNEKFKIGTKMQEKLKANNIDYVETEGTDGKKLKMLVYVDPDDGSTTPIVANKADIDRVPGSYSTDAGEATLSKAAVTLDAVKTDGNNSKIFASLDTATITLTGKIAGWFDSMTDALLTRIGGKDARSKLSNLGNDATEEEVEENIYKNVSEGDDGSDTDYTAKDTDENGEKLDDATVEENRNKAAEIADADDALKITDGADAATKTANTLKAKAQKVVAVGGGVACMALRGIGVISATVGAIQTANVVNFALKYLEAADRIKAGDATNAVNIMQDELTKTVTTTVYDSSGSKAEEISVTGSTASSAGWNDVFSNLNLIDENNPSANMVNREHATKTALTSAGAGAFSGLASSLASFGASITAFKMCNGFQAVMGLADGISDVILAFSTVGIGNFIKAFIKGALESAALSAAMIGVSAIISLITPMVAKWLGSYLLDIFMGDVGGYALNSGSHVVFDGNLQMSTGVYASRDQAAEMYAMTRTVEKEWAAYDRATLSPLDTSSPYTFMGSIATSLTPLINTSSQSALGVISSSIKLANNSLVALVNPTASAANETADFKASLASDGNCPQLAAVGVAGDFACNKYSGAYLDDVDTMDPYEVYEKISDNFDGEDSDGNPQIKENSDFAKYIVACVTSDTQPGTMNASVEGYIQKAQNAITGGSTVGNSLLSFGSNFIPFEGFLDAIDAGEQEANLPWNSGQACTDDQYRYFSTYNLDQRVMEGMGMIKESSVAAFLDDYYAENPLDNSFEGVIARYSGMTKDQVEGTLALIEYLDYIANYDASERYAFSDTSNSGAQLFSEKIFIADSLAYSKNAILENKIIYYDLRSRVRTV